MWKKPLIIVGLLGVLLIISGLILSPSFVGNFTSGGKLESLLRITQVQLAQIYMIIFGFLLAVGSLIMNFLSKEKLIPNLLVCLVIFGIVLVTSAIILSPRFIERNLSSQNFLNEGVLGYLSSLQIKTITVGCVIVLVSLLIYLKKVSIRQWWLFLLSTILVLIGYCVIIYNIYIKENFPNNFLLVPKEYGKVIDLILGKEILLTDFEPTSTLVVERKKIFKSKYPIIDVHFHLVSDFRTDLDKDMLLPNNLKKSLDSVGVKTIVNLDGIDIKPDVMNYHKLFPETFIDFAYPPLGSGELVRDETLAALPSVVEDLVKRGAYGIGEFPKYLGISIKDVSGKLIAIDDARLDPFWSKMAELKVPILWHCVDPTSFFQPINKYNERFTELGRYPFWSYYKPGVPTKEELLRQQENVIKKHPGLLVIGAHMGMCADNLKRLAYMFDTYPNYFVDCSATLSELGRQPYTARKFFIKYQDRILFGSDGGALHGVKGWTVEKFYQAYFEFFETENEYIEYPMQGAIDEGSWKIYGINLPDDVLEKLYNKNAKRILPNIFKEGFFVNPSHQSR